MLTNSERRRPGLVLEGRARNCVRARHVSATSAYCEDVAIVYEETTGVVLGSALAGDWAVEYAWLDAADKLARN
ncbi:hypothetical protein ACW910_21715 (plasmid) [Burkholderia ambifaria]